MFTIKKILIPVDFSGTGVKVLDQATLMAKKTNAEIILLTVLEGPFSYAGPDNIRTSVYKNQKYEKQIFDEADNDLNKLKEKLVKAGVNKVRCVIKAGGTPYKKILLVAKQTKADLIMMGTHGVSGFREFVVGSNTFKVVSESQCPVLSIQRHTKTAGFKNILLPFRDKPHSREKVDYAIDIAKIYGATLHILGVSYDPTSAGVKKMPLEAEQIKRIAEKQGVKCTEEVAHGNYVAKFIFDHAKEVKADLIVMMADLDKMTISQYIVGPVIQQIVNHSKVPILSIHPIINPETTDNDGADWSF
jgi:nucleotide-binding universal stress UspA family protein